MSTYQTDEEQVEAIKKWWKQNGKSVIGGVGLGLAIVLGWQAWQQYTVGQAEIASSTYDLFNQSYKNNDKQQIVSMATELEQQNSNSTYAAFSALKMAKFHFSEGDVKAAKQQLENVISGSADEGIKQLANIRLAKILLEENDVNGAKAIISKTNNAAFAGELAVLSGDIARSEGDMEKARSEYKKASELGVADRSLLLRKLAESGEQG